MVPAQAVGFGKTMARVRPKKTKKRVNFKEEEGQMIFQPPSSSK